MSETVNNKITLTETEFCKAVGISRLTAWRMREAGKLSHCRIGNKILYLYRHVDEFLNLHERPTREAQRNKRQKSNSER